MSDNQRLRKSSYLPFRGLSIALPRLVTLLLLSTTTGRPAPAVAQAPLAFAPDADCAPHLTRLFAPLSVGPASLVGYVVCRSVRPLDELRPPSWAVADVAAGEAFAGASPEVRRALVLIYGGRRLRVARGWIAHADAPNRVESSVALIAPAPADSLDRIAGGTLIIRTRIARQTVAIQGL